MLPAPSAGPAAPTSPSPQNMRPTNPPSSHLDSSSLYSNPLIALALPSAYFCKNILLPGKRPNPFHANRRWFGSIGGHNRPRQGSPSTSSMTNLHASARPIQLLPTDRKSVVYAKSPDLG